MTAMQMLTNLKNEELEAVYPDWEMLDALDAAIEVMTDGNTEENTSRMAKVLIDVRDHLQYPEDDEIEAMNTAIIALIKAA